MMLTTQELEAACAAGQAQDYSRHDLEPAELSLKAVYYPLGFPTEVRTNSSEALEIIDTLWNKFQQQWDTEPIISEIHMVEDDSSECPPEPVYRIVRPLLLGIADGSNYSIADMERDRVQIVVSRAALRHKLYAGYFLLAASGSITATRYATPIHAGCVAFDGKGVLLCGDSGAGKSTLSYACARAGWTYISDDGTYLINHRNDRLVTGDCHRVRFRPTAAELFPEIRGLEITPRAAGKPSIELPTAPMSHIRRAQTANAEFLVFLNRRSGKSPQLVPYCKGVARNFARQSLFSLPKARAMQHQAIDRLLEADVFELHYSDLDWAIQRLEQLVREGH
jgi:hypothetical protein